MGGLLQMAVERSAQRIVGDQRFAKPLSGMGDSLLHPGIVGVDILLQPLT